MSPDAIDDPAAEGCLLVHGDDGYRVDLEAHRWLAAARAASVTDLDVEVVDQPGRLEGLRRGLAQVPFLSDRRHVLVRDPPQLAERARRGADSAEELAILVAALPASTALCLVAHQRVAPANPVLAAVRAAGGRVVERPTLKGRELRQWVDSRVAALGLEVPRPAVDRVVQVAAGDLGVVEGELAKLAAFSAGQRVDLVDARRLIAGSERLEVWDVLDRLLSSTPARGAAAVDSLLGDGVAVQYIASVLAGQLRDVLRVLELGRGGTRASEVASRLGLPPWRAERLIRWAAVVCADTVEGWLRGLHHIDAEMKQGRLDDAAALRSLMLRAAWQVATDPSREPAPGR